MKRWPVPFGTEEWGECVVGIVNTETARGVVNQSQYLNFIMKAQEVLRIL